MRSGKIDSLQALRAIAAILVMLFHIGEILPELLGESFAGNWFRHGEAGVDIFFVLSGFIIYYSVQGRPEMGRSDFLLARFFRLYPIYWIVIGTLILAETLNLSGGNPHRLDPSIVLTSILLVPAPDYVLSVAWTLVIEVIFYVLFAVFFFVSKRAYFLAVFAWSGLAIAARFFPIENAPFWVSNYLLYSGVIEFAFGSVAAWLCIEGKTKFGNLALVVGGIGFTLGLADTGPLAGLGREFVYGVPAFLMIFGAYSASLKVPRWLVEVGDSSYMLYLIHGTCLSIFFRVVMKFNLPDFAGAQMTAALAAIASIIAAYVGHRTLERPLLRQCRKLTQAKKTWTLGKAGPGTPRAADR